MYLKFDLTPLTIDLIEIEPDEVGIILLHLFEINTIQFIFQSFSGRFIVGPPVDFEFRYRI